MRIAPFKLERFFAKYEFTTRFLLSSSDCESMTIEALLALSPDAKEGLHKLWLGYTESQGHPALRDEITSLYEQIDSSQVLVHAGAEEAIFNFMHCLLSPGDHLIVHTPGYQSSYSVAASLGAHITHWNADEDKGWALSLADLEAAITPTTKAIFLNCPHNPTGYLMDLGSFNKVIHLARKHGLYLFCDEVYRELEHDEATRLPAVCDLYEKGVSLGVMSKTYGLPGLRIGWVATQDEWMLSQMASFKDYTTICNSAPSEYLAQVALAHRHELSARNLGIIRANLLLADDFFARHEALFEWKRPGAGPIGFPKYLGGSAEAFCVDAAERAGVLLLPSTMFDWKDGHIRFGFGRQNFPEALAALEAFIAEGDVVG